MSIELLNIDCVEYMASMPDNYFDLALVDPPYGIGENWKKDRYSKFHSHESSYKNNHIPDQAYFSELFRVSRNQIIWGGNYYTQFLNPTGGWIVWNKERSFESTHMAECELAWTSFKIPARIIKRAWNGFCRAEPRYGVHPHEKPIGLYTWLLDKYAVRGWKVLDTHLGSASSAIAAHYFSCDFVGCEIDEMYWKAALERVAIETKQSDLFRDAKVSSA